MNFPARLFAIVTLIACFVAAHYSAQAATVKYTSGTGFFITKDGLFITNAHVVRGCKNISIAGAANANANIVALDEEHDLALLKARTRAPQIAPLRFDLRHMRKGQKVAIVGYPGDSGFKGNLIYRSAQLLGFEGPIGEPHFLQFSSAAQKGNSGGPLLDQAGNVIGVVTGKTKLYEVSKTSQNAAPKLVREADVAVTLPYLKKFLGQHRIRTAKGGNGMIRMSPKFAAKNSSKFILHVRCRL
jgi:S1-C subfamily serine protease